MSGQAYSATLLRGPQGDDTAVWDALVAASLLLPHLDPAPPAARAPVPARPGGAR